MTEHDNAYAGLMVNDAHWAFGTDFDDPLAGIDTAVPSGVDGAVLARYCLMLGDDALVFSQRLSQWCSRAPDLEEDIAVANIALDLLGQARLLLARAATADPGVVPALPPGSPVPAEDALAFFRDDAAFFNVRLVELPNGDFAELVTRLLLVSAYRLALFERLTDHADAVLAAVAAKGVKELAYHRDFAARWFVTLARGTDESRRRVEAALAELMPWWPELFETHPTEAAVGIAPAELTAPANTLLDHVLEVSTVDRPTVKPVGGTKKGRDGVHTEALSHMLAEMQVVARAHPMGRW